MLLSFLVLFLVWRWKYLFNLEEPRCPGMAPPPRFLPPPSRESWGSPPVALKDFSSWLGMISFLPPPHPGIRRTRPALPFTPPGFLPPSHLEGFPGPRLSTPSKVTDFFFLSSSGRAGARGQRVFSRASCTKEKGHSRGVPRCQPFARTSPALPPSSPYVAGFRGALGCSMLGSHHGAPGPLHSAVSIGCPNKVRLS